MDSRRIDKISPAILLQMFVSVMNESSQFEHISGIQPFFMRFGDKHYHVFIKNLSSAYFEGREATTRAQLPRRSEFDEIKNSPYIFLFLGYDADNDIYVCWDYNVAKKRLNATSNVSFYSRSHFQTSVKKGEFSRGVLKNGDTPVLFKRDDLVMFFNSIETLFSVENAPTLPFQNKNNKEIQCNPDVKKEESNYIPKPLLTPVEAGKLTHIDDEELLQRIRSMVESHRILQAAQEAAKHYLHQYPEMSLSDWMSLVKNTENVISKDDKIEQVDSNPYNDC